MLNDRALRFVKNFSYTIASNLITMIVSTLVVFIIPKLLGVEEYGYWQLYLFYSAYVPFLQFGWSDGVYLRYGGKEYEELDKSLFFSQFIMLFTFQCIIAVVMLVLSDLFVLDINKLFIIRMTAIYLVLINTRYLFIYILQGTNRFKEYALIIMTDRVLYIGMVIVFLVLGVREYKLMIIADLIGKFLSFLYVLYKCYDIVFQKISTFYFNLKESINNISAGIKLMFSNTASMLIMGVVRFGIERSWNVSTFGRVSLTLNISNFMMVFINAVGIIMFPILRKTDKKKLPSIYETMRTFLMVFMLGILILYYPLRVMLSAWLPQYDSSLLYMALVFPMSVYEGKMVLLINTYLKTLRKEKLMLKINLISLAISVIFSFITTALFRNLDMAVASIVIILAFRCVLAEIVLSKILNIFVYKDIILELMLTFIFIITGWFINSWISLFIYLIAYVVYLVFKRKDITNTIINVKLLMKA